MIITISGLPGSGKSTVGKLLAKRLGYKFYSMGDLRGEIAMKMGITIDELNEIGRREFWTDEKIDKRIRHLGETEDNFVIDGWTASHFIPHSFKVFLDVDAKIGAERIFKDQRPDERKTKSVEEVMKMLKNRVAETDKRYKKYYSLDFRDKRHYDLVIDTTRLKPDEVVSKILKAVKIKKDN
jgi:predicted cytidylate kinase